MPSHVEVVEGKPSVRSFFRIRQVSSKLFDVMATAFFFIIMHIIGGIDTGGRPCREKLLKTNPVTEFPTIMECPDSAVFLRKIIQINSCRKKKSVAKMRPQWVMTIMYIHY